MSNPVVRASGLRAVAAATALGLVADALCFAVLLESASPSGSFDPAQLELGRLSIGLSSATIGMLWIWGAVRAAGGDAGAAGGLLALAATVAFAAVAAGAVVTLEPLLDPNLRLADDARMTLAAAVRMCRAAAQLAFALALARLAWHERRGLAMFGAAVAFVVSAPMLVLDPVAMALDRSQTSLVGGWCLTTIPPLLVVSGIATAVWGLPAPAPSVWQAMARSLELLRAASVGVAVVAAASAATRVFADAHAVQLGVPLTVSLGLFGIAAAVGSYRTSRRSVRWARWSFGGAALSILVLVAIEVFLDALVPLGVAIVPPHQLALAEQVRGGLVVVSLSMLVIGCARTDPALRRPAVAAAVSLGLAACAGAVAIVLGHHPILQRVPPEVVVGALVVLSVNAVVMVLRLLGKGVGVAHARAFGERVRAAEYAAEQARLVHERWRAARRR